MIQDLLVATTGDGDDAAALATAIALASESSARVTVLVQARFRLPVPDSGAMGVFPVGDYHAMIEEALREGEAACSHWRDVLRQSGTPGEVRFEQAFPSNPPETASVRARYCDASLIGMGAFGSLPGPVHEQFAKLLVCSGRPVVAVPRGWIPAPVRRVAVGWHSGAPAARAVHDAFEWLARASEVDVVCVGGKELGDEPGTDLAAHLARHGIRVNVHCAGADDRDPGATLLQRAGELGADLLVAGGYGHSRFREWALGGTTRHLLHNASLPVFFSH